MSSGNNLDRLDELLQAITDGTVTPPLWVQIRDRMDQIEQARERGITHRQLAAAAGVSERVWYRALARAKRNSSPAPSTSNGPRKHGTAPTVDDFAEQLKKEIIK